MSEQPTLNVVVTLYEYSLDAWFQLLTAFTKRYDKHSATLIASGDKARMLLEVPQQQWSANDRAFFEQLVKDGLLVGWGVLGGPLIFKQIDGENGRWS